MKLESHFMVILSYDHCAYYEELFFVAYQKMAFNKHLDYSTSIIPFLTPFVSFYSP